MVKIVPWIILVIWFLFLLFLESKTQIRPRPFNKKSHVFLNLGYFVISSPLNRFFSLALLMSVDKVKPLFIIPFFPMRPLFLIILLDLIIYYWHRMNHEIPFLWNFHKFHHVDKEMDVSTALRFHIGEFFFSFVFKGIIMLFLGITAFEYIFFEMFVTGASLFHHSNIKLSGKLQKILHPIIVTPDYHHAHHSIVIHETNSNYGTIFSFWDKLHRTRTQKQPKEIIIGLQEYSQTPTFKEGLLMPWKKS
jgi:sterol desaturase/sphingolipid hydroxylase (fatty acid hydroxylase superfamily)